MHARRRAVTLSLATAIALTAGAPGATSALAAPTPDSPAAPAPPAASPDGPRPLTPEQVKAQVAQAQALQKRLTAVNADAAAANAEVNRLSARSSAAMNAVATARAAEAAARRTEQVHLARLRTLSRQAAAAHEDVTDMAYDAYVNGAGSLQEIAAFVDLLTSEGEQAQRAALAGYLADVRAAQGRRYTSLAQAQQASAKAAVAARQAREAATAKAQEAQKSAQASLAAQQAALRKLQESAQRTSEQLGDLGLATGGVDLASLEKLAEAPLCSDDAGVYPNGDVPRSALCPIETAPGHMLRPAAARAFNALKVAYARDLGSELCLTDSYRSLQAQIAVKSSKPTLAAAPGTSQHGLGLAVDLCGGIESFGTAQHQWMRRHAPLFGFYHPAWAGPDGAKPEPWHWEFAG